MKKLYSLITILLIAIASYAQPNGPWMHSPYLNINGAQDEWKQTNFYEIQKAFYTYEKDYEATHPHVDLRVDNSNWEDEENEVPGRLQFKRWEWFIKARMNDSGDISESSTTWQKYQQYRTELSNSRTPSEGMAANWTEMGPALQHSYPDNGRINFIRFHPTDTNTMWAGTATGGLWKTTNGGTTWTTNSDAMGVLTCSDMAINPTNPNIMYLATGDDDYSGQSIGILKTVNGGATWTSSLPWVVSQTYIVYRLIMNPVNPNILFAVTTLGIYRTTDAGGTWSLVLSGSGCNDIEFKPGDPNTLYTVNGNNGKYYRSTDGGTTFNNLINFSNQLGKYLIAVSAADPTVVYILRYSGFNTDSLFRSADGGTSFTRQSSTYSYMGVQGWGDLALTVNPFNASDVYIGGTDGYRSTNAGVSWSAFNLGNSFGDYHGIEFKPGSSTILYTCNDGGIGKNTANATVPFTNVSATIANSQVYKIGNSATKPNLLMEGSQDVGMRIYSSGTWTFGPLGASGDIEECIIDYTDTNIMYWSHTSGYIYKSINAGSSYSYIATTSGTGVNASGDWVTPFIMHPTDHNTILVGKGQVFRTTNAGATWSQVGTITAQVGRPNIVALAYAPSNPNYIYAATPNKLFVSTDGNTFVERTGIPTYPPYITSIAVSSSNPQKVWMTYNGYTSGSKVFYSSDAGQTWTNYSTGLPNLSANTIVYQNGSNDGLYLGMDVGVYYRNATMSSWSLYNTGLANAIVNELEIQYSSGKIRAGTYGRGVWESQLNLVGIDELSNSESNISIYPNPAKDNVTITINNQSSIHKNELSIYNVVGEKVYSETLTSKVEMLNVEQFSAGVYFVKVSNGEKTFSQKLIIQ